MPSVSSSVRRTTRTILVTGFIWLLVCWAFTIHQLIASTPPVTPLLTNEHNYLKSERSQSSEARQLDQVPASGRNHSGSNLQNDHNARNAANEITAPIKQSTIADPPPISSLVFPLHAKSGTHHAYLYIGSPPQRQTLIVDTGSRLTAFPCRPKCSDCGVHASPRFDINHSSSLSIIPCDECVLSRKDFELEAYFKGDGVGGNSGDGNVNVDLMPKSVRGAAGPIKRLAKRKTCKKKQCDIDQRYTEGSSWNAFEVKDNVWLGFADEAESNAQHATYSRPFVFGCQTSQEGLFKKQYADGIMGMSMYTQTLVGSWYKQGAIQHDSFSLCFNSKGGHMSLGGTASSYEQTQQHGGGARHLMPMQFIPLARDNTWYYTVHVTSISVGEYILPSEALQFLNDHKGTIVDSGTTDTFLSHKVAKVRSMTIFSSP